MSRETPTRKQTPTRTLTKTRTRSVARGLMLIGLLGSFVLASSGHARAQGELPPWYEADDVPLPIWVRSVAPKRVEVPLYKQPGMVDQRRGTPMTDARLPIFGAKRAPGCTGRWLEVGPMSWVCSDAVNFSADPPSFPVQHVGADGLPFRYFFIGKNGASGFLNLGRALDDPPDQELDPGWAVGVSEERDAHGERWALTNHGHWIAVRELGAARPPTFEGAQIEDGKLDVAFVAGERVNVYSTSKLTKAVGARVRNELVHIHETAGQVYRISDDGAEPEAWIRARDVIKPSVSEPPQELSGPYDKWLDVDVATQTLVAYVGARPVFATLVSTGKGVRGSATATRLGVHRIWVKLVSTNMGNLENEDADEHYSIEDVPWVQFFDKAIALHAAFWHHEFGHVHSHGCVNLTPHDAEFLFRFTGPHMPRGWIAVLPTDLEPGTLVRVR